MPSVNHHTQTEDVLSHADCVVHMTVCDSGLNNVYQMMTIHCAILTRPTGAFLITVREFYSGLMQLNLYSDVNVFPSFAISSLHLTNRKIQVITHFQWQNYFM